MFSNCYDSYRPVIRFFLQYQYSAVQLGPKDTHVPSCYVMVFFIHCSLLRVHFKGHVMWLNIFHQYVKSGPVLPREHRVEQSSWIVHWTNKCIMQNRFACWYNMFSLCDMTLKTFLNIKSTPNNMSQFSMLAQFLLNPVTEAFTVCRFCLIFLFTRSNLPPKLFHYFLTEKELGQF